MNIKSSEVHSCNEQKIIGVMIQVHHHLISWMNLHKNSDSYVRQWTKNLSRIFVHTQMKWIDGSCYVIAERIFAYRGQTNFTICVDDHNTHIHQGKQMHWLAQKDQLDFMGGISIHTNQFSLSWIICCVSETRISESSIAISILYCI